MCDKSVLTFADVLRQRYGCTSNAPTSHSHAQLSLLGQQNWSSQPALLGHEADGSTGASPNLAHRLVGKVRVAARALERRGFALRPDRT